MVIHVHQIEFSQRLDYQMTIMIWDKDLQFIPTCLMNFRLTPLLDHQPEIILDILTNGKDLLQDHLQVFLLKLLVVHQLVIIQDTAIIGKDLPQDLLQFFHLADLTTDQV